MAGFQSVTIIGNIGKSPETSFTPAGMQVTKFSVATSKKIKGEDVTSWHRCVSFSKTAELIAQYFDKGSQIHIEGELQYSSYEKDGLTKHYTDIIVNKFTFVGGKGQNNQNQGYQNQGQQQGYQQNQNQGYQQQQGGFPGNQVPPDDSIPF